MLRQSGLQAAFGDWSSNRLELGGGPYRVTGITPCLTMQLYPFVLLLTALITLAMPLSTRRFFIVLVLLILAVDLVILQHNLGVPLARGKHRYASAPEYYPWFWLAQAALVWAMIVEYRAMRKVARLTEATVDAR